MSLHTSGQGSRSPIGWEDFPDDRKDKSPPYTQEPVFEGSYIDDDDVLILTRNSDLADCSDSDSIEGGFTNPAYQNPPQNPQYPPCPQNPADLHQLQQDQLDSQYIAPDQPYYGAYGTPPEYIAHQNDANARIRYGTPAPQGMQATGQQPAFDPRSVVVSCPPPTTGQCVIKQPQGFGGQPPAIVVRPILEDPPNDYMCYSVFVTFCCCWFIGVVAISKSRECRRAIAMGNRGLAKEKSISARNTAHVSLALGIVAFIITGVVLGVRVAYMTRKL